MKINKKIKFWIFYIIKDNDYGYENEIYAYTNDKSLYELFIKTRKMDMFYVKSIKLTKELFEKKVYYD